jgi:hypothetical protein
MLNAEYRMLLSAFGSRPGFDFFWGFAVRQHLPDLCTPKDAALAVDLVPGLVAVSR